MNLWVEIYRLMVFVQERGKWTKIHGCNVNNEHENVDKNERQILLKHVKTSQSFMKNEERNREKERKIECI